LGRSFFLFFSFFFKLTVIFFFFLIFPSSFDFFFFFFLLSSFFFLLFQPAKQRSNRMSHISRRTTDTFRTLKTQSLVLEQQCIELRNGLQKPPPMILNGGPQVRILRQVEEETNKVEQEVASFYQTRAAEPSFEKLFSNCGAMFTQIEEQLNSLETKLSEYGYTRSAQRQSSRQGLPFPFFISREEKKKKNSNGHFFYSPSPGKENQSLTTPSKLNMSEDSSCSTPPGVEDSPEEEVPDITQDLANLTREIMTPGLLRNLVPSEDNTPTESPMPGRRAPYDFLSLFYWVLFLLFVCLFV